MENVKEIDIVRYLKLTKNKVYYSYRHIKGDENFTARSINETFNGRVMDYLKDCIDSSEYQGKESTTLKEDLVCLSSEFQRVALHRRVIMNRNSKGRKEAFKNYLLGLPSHIYIPFYYYDMFNLLGDLLEDEKLKDEIIEIKVDSGHLKGKTLKYIITLDSMSDFYYKIMEIGVNDLLKVNNLPQLHDLKTID